MADISRYSRFRSCLRDQLTARPFRINKSDEFDDMTPDLLDFLRLVIEKSSPPFSGKNLHVTLEERQVVVERSEFFGFSSFTPFSIFFFFLIDEKYLVVKE